MKFLQRLFRRQKPIQAIDLQEIIDAGIKHHLGIIKEEDQAAAKRAIMEKSPGELPPYTKDTVFIFKTNCPNCGQQLCLSSRRSGLDDSRIEQFNVTEV